ncbi:MAG: DUF2510 domain-containing protein, partial [Comamonadaceae bacterium]
MEENSQSDRSDGPPGWHQDPADANLLRYWDGRQWTEQTQPKPSQTPTPRKGGVGKVLLILAAVLVVMGILGAVFGGGDKKDDKPAAAAGGVADEDAADVVI